MVEVVPVPASSGNKNKNIIIALVSIIAVILLFTTGYFLSKNQSLEKLVIEAKEQNAELEKDIIFYKNTDLAKDNELLTLKLENIEKDLAAREKELAVTTEEKAGLVKQLQAVQANSAKIQIHLDAIDQIERMVGDGPNQASVNLVEPKITVLQNAKISKAWEEAKRWILDNVATGSWNGTLIADTVIAITSTIRGLLTQ